jgi:hypothetical protein
MADTPVSQFVSLYYNSKKIDTSQDTSVEVDNNSTHMFGDGKVAAIAQGVTTVQSSATLVFDTTDTNSTDMLAALLSKKQVTLSYLFATKLFSVQAVVTKASLKSASKSGESTWSMSFINAGEPKLT